MAHEISQTLSNHDIADMLQTLSVSSGTMSQPPSPTDSPTNYAPPSSSCFLPTNLLHNDLGNATCTNYGFPPQQDYSNYNTDFDFLPQQDYYSHSRSAVNCVSGGGFLPPQAWNTGYNQEPPLDWSYNPYAPPLGGTCYFPSATPMVQNHGKERFLQRKRNYAKELSEQEASQVDLTLLNKLTGQEIVSLAKNQTGSLYLQRIMMDAATAEKILDRVAGCVFDLMADQFGCYVFQKLILLCGSQKQFEKIVSELVDHDQLISSVKTTAGSLSIQKLFRSLKKEAPSLIENVMSALKPSLVPLMMDVSGRYLIVDCLRQLNHEQNRPIFVAAANNCIELAENNEGYHVMIAVLETVQDASLRMQILTIITKNCVYLAQVPNGNFVLRKVIDLQDPSITEIICRKLKPYAVRLSMHKSACRVIEKCVESSGMEHLASELIQSDLLVQVAKDHFGHSILQKILKTSKIRFHHIYLELQSRLNAKLSMLQKNQNSRNVLKYL